MKGPCVEGLENCSGGKRSVEIMFLKPVKHCYLFSLIRSETDIYWREALSQNLHWGLGIFLFFPLAALVGIGGPAPLPAD